MNKIEFLSKMKDPNVYMHITRDLGHTGEFKCRVPENRLKGWNEDGETPRICVAEDLNGCLTGAGIDENTLVKVFFIDIEKLGLEDSIVKWNELYEKDLVTDAVYTKEAWILKSFKVDEEDSIIISLNGVDEDSLYLVEYNIQKEADELGVDEVDLYEEKFDFLPRCISYYTVDNDNFTTLNKDVYEEFWKTTQMIEGEEDCLMDASFGLYDYEDEIDELEHFKRKHDVEFLGEGGARKVFSFGNYVVKMPKAEDGELQSKQEISIYNDSKETLSILNPSYRVFYDDVVFQPKLYSMSKSDSEKYNTILEYLKDNDFDEEYINLVEKEISILINKYRLIEEDLLKMCSWGVKEGYDEKVHLLDYGTTKDIYEEYYE